MSVFRGPFIGIGNLCRSPLGERLLASQLPADTFEVCSAGVGAMAGSAMVPEAAAHLETYGGSADGFVTRQLSGALVKQSDLPDAYGRGDDAHALAARTTAVTVDRIAGGLSG